MAGSQAKIRVQPLTFQEIMSMLKATSNRKSYFTFRSYIMIVVAWRTLVRATELVSIQVNDVDIDQGTIRIQNGKGSKYRTVAFDHHTGELLREWLIAVRKRFPDAVEVPWLFPSAYGQRLYRSQFLKACKGVARKAKVTKRVHPHGFRHTGAIEMLNEGLNIGDIQQQLGHSSIARTEIYLRALNPYHMIDKMRKRTW